MELGKILTLSEQAIMINFRENCYILISLNKTVSLHFHFLHLLIRPRIPYPRKGLLTGLTVIADRMSSTALHTPHPVPPLSNLRCLVFSGCEVQIDLTISALGLKASIIVPHFLQFPKAVVMVRQT